jgi:hypothetical protein
LIDRLALSILVTVICPLIRSAAMQPMQLPRIEYLFHFVGRESFVPDGALAHRHLDIAYTASPDF